LIAVFFVCKSQLSDKGKPKEDSIMVVKFISPDTVQILKEGEYVINNYVKVK
jgi:hypothetical protein